MLQNYQLLQKMMLLLIGVNLYDLLQLMNGLLHMTMVIVVILLKILSLTYLQPYHLIWIHQNQLHPVRIRSSS